MTIPERKLRKKDLFLLPNLFTASRVVAIPLILFLAYVNRPLTNLVAAGAFAAVQLTDMIDGYLARRYHMVTRFGKLLDPIADKLILMTCMIMLLAMGKLAFEVGGVEYKLIGPLLVIVTVGRAIAITGLRSIASSEGIVLAAGTLGKRTTFVQSTAVFLLLLGRENSLCGIDWQQLGLILLFVSVVLALISGIRYVLDFYHALPHDSADL